jgi:hypothetical protein
MRHPIFVNYFKAEDKVTIFFSVSMKKHSAATPDFHMWSRQVRHGISSEIHPIGKILEWVVGVF